MVGISSKVESIPFSSIRRMSELASELEKEGRHIIHLELGRPDFDTPSHIKEAAIKALMEGKVHYTSNYGITELRHAIADKIRTTLGVEYDPASEIIVTAGGAEAIYLAFASLLEPGDKVMVLTPCWPNYLHVPKLMNASVIEVELRQEDDYQITKRRLEEFYDPAVKLIVINSPCNPTGGILETESLEAVKEFALKHSLYVISDEVYEAFTYDTGKHLSILRFTEIKDRVILVNSFSKTYSMTGWRVGYVAAEAMVARAMVKVHQNLIACSTSFAQAGALAALTGPQECVQEMKKEYERRMNLVVQGLNEIPVVRCNRPKGAFYVFPSVDAFGMESSEVSEFLLREAGVVTVPGSGFGKGGEGHIRISYAASYSDLEIALEKIAIAFQKLR